MLTSLILSAQIKMFLRGQQTLKVKIASSSLSSAVCVHTESMIKKLELCLGGDAEIYICIFYPELS